MNLLPRFPWLGRARLRREPGHKDTDLGDMGTTYALDAAMPRLNDASRVHLQGRDGVPADDAWDPSATRPSHL